MLCNVLSEPQSKCEKSGFSCLHSVNGLAKTVCDYTKYGKENYFDNQQTRKIAGFI